MKGKKTGGRKPGSPNKATVEVKTVITALLHRYMDSGMMEQDLMDIDDPKDRLALVEKLIQYIAPKMQAVAFSEAEEGTKTIEDRLIDLSRTKDTDK